MKTNLTVLLYPFGSNKGRGSIWIRVGERSKLPYANSSKWKDFQMSPLQFSCECSTHCKEQLCMNPTWICFTLHA